MIISNYKTLNEEWFPQFPESVAYGISRELCDKLKTDRKSIENEFLEFHIEKESDVEKIRDVRINHTFSEYLYYEKIAEEKRVTIHPPIKDIEEIDGRCVTCGKTKITHSWNEWAYCSHHLEKGKTLFHHGGFLRLFGNSFRNAYDNSETNHIRLYGRLRRSSNETIIWNIFCKNYIECIFRIVTF